MILDFTLHYFDLLHSVAQLQMSFDIGFKSKMTYCKSPMTLHALRRHFQRHTRKDAGIFSHFDAYIDIASTPIVLVYTYLQPLIAIMLILRKYWRYLIIPSGRAREYQNSVTHARLSWIMYDSYFAIKIRCARNTRQLLTSISMRLAETWLRYLSLNGRRQILSLIFAISLSAAMPKATCCALDFSPGRAYYCRNWPIPLPIDINLRKHSSKKPSKHLIAITDGHTNYAAAATARRYFHGHGIRIAGLARKYADGDITLIRRYFCKCALFDAAAIILFRASCGANTGIRLRDDD